MPGKLALRRRHEERAVLTEAKLGVHLAQLPTLHAYSVYGIDSVAECGDGVAGPGEVDEFSLEGVGDHLRVPETPLQYCQHHWVILVCGRVGLYSSQERCSVQQSLQVAQLLPGEQVGVVPDDGVVALFESHPLTRIPAVLAHREFR